MNVQVVLTADDPKLGKRGEVVKVSSGYAQNFLFPHKKAVPATPSALKAVEESRARRARQETEALEEARSAAKRLSATVLTLPVQAGEGDKLYGAVTSADIQEALAAAGVRVERKDVHLDEPIKRLGEHTVPLKLHPEITVTLRLNVERRP